MHFAKLSIVFLALIALLCSANIIMKTDQPKGVAELEDAAVNILTNCYADRGKTILVVGSFPKSFLHNLTSRGRFSLVFLDDTKRPMNNINHLLGQNGNTLYKVNIVIMQAWKRSETRDVLLSLMHSRYYNHMASFLVIDFTTERRCKACGGINGLLALLSLLHSNSIQNANLLYFHNRFGTLLFGFNAYNDRVLKPWQFLGSAPKIRGGPNLVYVLRKYHENKDTCKNLYYDKTHDLGGYPVKIAYYCRSLNCSRDWKQIRDKEISSRSPYGRVNNERLSGYIKDFLVYVNATAVEVYQEVSVGGTRMVRAIHFEVEMLRDLNASGFIYPHEMECFYLVTRHRGNKSTVQKIIAVIDNYSWIGIAVVCGVCLMFFKYFFRQPLMDAVLNIVRLCSNFGIPVVPENVASRIYMACLLFFVVTMQGIFVSNLSALLTQDIPLQHVESFKDVADFGYTPYAYQQFFSYFTDYLPEENIHFIDPFKKCVFYIATVPSAVCISPRMNVKDAVDRHHLHASKCVIMEYITHRVGRFWPLEERMHTFLLHKTASGTVMSLNYSVAEKRLLEAEAEAAHNDPEPRKITLNDLVFAFVILGVGLACASVTFVVEILIHWYHRRVRRTRVQIIN